MSRDDLVYERKKKKPDYSPPGWPVWKYDITLDRELAARFQELRQRMCDKLGEDHPRCKIDNIWTKMVEMFLANEISMCAKIERTSEEE